MTLFSVNESLAQKVAKDKNGELIIKFEDGSWRFFDSNDPSDVLLLEQQTGNRNLASDSKKKKEKTKKSKKKKNKSKSNKNRDLVVAESKSKKSKGGKKPKRTKNSKKGKKKGKKSKGTMALSAREIENVESKIKQVILQTRDDKISKSELERQTQFQKNILMSKLTKAKKRKEGEIKIKSIENRIKQSNILLKKIKKENRWLKKKRKAYAKALSAPPEHQQGQYLKLQQKYMLDDNENLAISNTKKKGKIKNIKKNKRSNKNTANTASSNVNRTQNTAVSWPSVDSKDTPPAPNCAVSFEGVDSFSGKKRKDLKARRFFSFTNEKMQKFFVERDMVTCEGYLSAVSGGLVFLSLEIVLASESAQTSYGNIEKGAMLSIKLVNGENINIKNNKTDDGILDPIAKTVLYKTQYLIPSQHIRTLGKVEIDQIRIVWGTGYEDYNIYETDFIMDQLSCLNK